MAAAGWVGWRLGRPLHVAAGVAAAMVALLAVGAVWATWFSPNADHRLALWPRVAGAVALLAACGSAVAALGRPWAGLALAVTGSLVMLTAQPALEGA